MKSSAAYLFMIATLVTSSSAFAISNSKLISKCFEVGRTKIAEQAYKSGCSVDLNQVSPQAVDKHWFLPFKYVWYQAPTDCQGTTVIQSMVEYFQGECH